MEYHIIKSNKSTISLPTAGRICGVVIAYRVMIRERFSIHKSWFLDWEPSKKDLT